MKFKLRMIDKRFNDPTWASDVARPSPAHADLAQTIKAMGKTLLRYDIAADPRSGDGKKTVIIHGKRVSEVSPLRRWPGAELWGVTRCNVLYWRESLADWTRWFDVHPVEVSAYHLGIKAKRPEAWAWYKRQTTGKPIYLLEPHPEVPDSVGFPRQIVQEALHSTRFTVSVDWMFALALYEGFERIVLNGIGTRFECDYQFTHQGILYWIGRAEGAGVEVVIEGPSCYHEPTKVYGWECGAPVWDKTPLQQQQEQLVYGHR